MRAVLFDLDGTLVNSLPEIAHGVNEALARQLKVMDSTAFSMCRDNDLPIIVFNFSDPDSLERILAGDTGAGTIVS